MQHGKPRGIAERHQNSAERIPASNSTDHHIEGFESQLGLHSSIGPSNVWPATPARRRGPCLARRTGQSGTVVQHSKTWDPAAPCYGKFWADVPGGPKRK